MAAGGLASDAACEAHALDGERYLREEAGNTNACGSLAAAGLAAGIAVEDLRIETRGWASDNSCTRADAPIVARAEARTMTVDR